MSIPCTALGGDHNKDHSPVKVEGVYYCPPPSNYKTVFCVRSSRRFLSSSLKLLLQVYCVYNTAKGFLITSLPLVLQQKTCSSQIHLFQNLLLSMQKNDIKTSVADPVHCFSDPDPGDPKKTVFDRIQIYLDMFLMFSKITIFFMAFLYQILWHLKSKIKNYFDETVF